MSSGPLLYHHPFSRAANVVWMLEEIGIPYELSYVDFKQGEHKAEAYTKLNPMGKLPTLVDGSVVVTESAAIGVYLADRYALGRLAPKLDEPDRGAYLRWSFFSPSVIEPGAYAKGAGWEVRVAQAGWGEFDAMVETMERAIGEGPWLLGERFSMADVILGGTVRYLLRFEMLPKRPTLEAYALRLSERAAAKTADAKNARIVKERGLDA